MSGIVKSTTTLSASLILAALLAFTSYSQEQKPATPAAVLERYCVTCHNERLKTAGLILEPAQLSRVADKPELWEKVIRKLRSSSMPPAGAPRPDKATTDSIATFLETELDRSAAAKPNPGTLPLFHRLSRTEYQNSIRDLLAINALPKEMDYEVLLPAD